MSPEKFIETLKGQPLDKVNSELERVCGIVDFFESEDYSLSAGPNQSNRVEYGDWQTNFELAKKVCLLLKKQGCNPSIVIEPTCGIGNFILASAIVFGDCMRYIFGIEIYKPYIQHCKYRILEYGLSNPGAIKCRIKLLHHNIFDFCFDNLDIPKHENVLILGNPPWVTNSKLGKINSENLPQKSNFKKIKGLDAITGKGNFDIAEYITYQLLDYFHQYNACLAFLMKSSVAKNIVFEQKNGKYAISQMSQYNIDAKKEFDVSVAASLFVAYLGKGNAKQCEIKDFYLPKESIMYGWVNSNFVSNTKEYFVYSRLDGHCQLEWWSGIKHDCSKVMELEEKNSRLYNKLHEEVNIEDDLLYPMLKSSDLKATLVETSRKYVIVTQKSTSDNTEGIKDLLPLTYGYLDSHSGYFDSRASVIYKDRSRFSIFGVGPYSFKDYKIAISGLYKTTTFSLIPPINGRCVMLDDTCYLMGFDNIDDAKCFLKILNSETVQNFLKSIVFFDAKRSINKELLMRIDLLTSIENLANENYISESEYNRAKQYILMHGRKRLTQLNLFDS